MVRLGQKERVKGLRDACGLAVFIQSAKHAHSCSLFCFYLEDNCFTIKIILDFEDKSSGCIDKEMDQ